MVVVPHRVVSMFGEHTHAYNDGRNVLVALEFSKVREVSFGFSDAHQLRHCIGRPLIMLTNSALVYANETTVTIARARQQWSA